MDNAPCTPTIEALIVDNPNEDMHRGTQVVTLMPQPSAGTGHTVWDYHVAHDSNFCPCQVTGFCPKLSGNRDIGKGNHVVSFVVAGPRDAYTGWASDSRIIIEEYDVSQMQV